MDMMYITDHYAYPQYPEYPPPYNYKCEYPKPGPGEYPHPHGAGAGACAYPNGMAGYLGAHPGAYSYDDLAAAARLSSYSSFSKGKNGRAKGEVVS